MISKDNDLEILLKTYDEELAKDITQNYKIYESLLTEIARYDIEKAIQLWEKLLESKKESLNVNGISLGIIDSILHKFVFILKEKRT